MGDVGSHLVEECATIVLSPASDLVILWGREIIRRTEYDLAEGPTHGDEECGGPED